LKCHLIIITLILHGLKCVVKLATYSIPYFESLSTSLKELFHKFSIIRITETKFSRFLPLYENFSLQDYSFEHTPTESSSGGALLYVANTLNYKVRSDLSDMFYKYKELESVFIELYFKSKNVIVGCIYRHPCMSISEFNRFYLSPLFDKLVLENKSIIFRGF